LIILLFVGVQVGEAADPAAEGEALVGTGDAELG
jgi:hypothetical protein